MAMWKLAFIWRQCVLCRWATRSSHVSVQSQFVLFTKQLRRRTRRKRVSTANAHARHIPDHVTYTSFVGWCAMKTVYMYRRGARDAAWMQAIRSPTTDDSWNTSPWRFKSNYETFVFFAVVSPPYNDNGTIHTVLSQKRLRTAMRPIVTDGVA